MNILSSNNSQFKITLDYMRTRGYVWYDLLEEGIYYLYRGHMYSDHKITGWYKGSELDHMWINLNGYPKIYIKTISDLDLLEKIWNEKNQKRKIALRKKLIKQCKA